jgi:hypothetical protein
MRKSCLFIFTLLLGIGASHAQEDMVFASLSTRLQSDSSFPVINKSISGLRNVSFPFITENKKPSKQVIGYSKQSRPIEVYYFPGISNKKAMVVGGIHGSELPSIEIAKRIIRELSKGGMPYYNVVVVPCLFPDNAVMAARAGVKRLEDNKGRYSHDEAVDPNRQMPLLGKAFHADEPYDANGRLIENENQILLQLIQSYLPDRIVNLHSIKDFSKAGIFADPRTDCNGIAQGFETDSLLAITMAQFIARNDGIIPGNHLGKVPTALYFNDPQVVAAGQWQQRNLHGSQLPNKRGQGASLGSWASTAVCDAEAEHYRPAIRLFTIEFPGYKTPSEYRTTNEQKKFSRLIDIYTAAVVNFFLGEYCVEGTAENPVVSK